jgi:hypothetical protein
VSHLEEVGNSYCNQNADDYANDHDLDKGEAPLVGYHFSTHLTMTAYEFALIRHIVFSAEIFSGNVNKRAIYRRRTKKGASPRACPLRFKTVTAWSVLKT